MDISFDIPPELLAPVDVGRNLKNAVRSELLPVSQRLVSALSAGTAAEGAESLAADFTLEVRETGDSVEVEFRNESDIWIFWEEDTAPHMPPFGEGSDLDEWAKERGLKTFPVALRIAEEGTEGHHVGARLMADHEDDLYDAMGRGFGDWVGRLGSS